MKSRIQSFSQGGILMKTAGLAWAIALIVVCIFIVLIVPSQKAVYRASLESKAKAISASLQEVTSGSVVSEDYTTVVDHCLNVLADDTSILYLVITRSDGFSLIHRPDQWETQQLDENWRPPDRHSRSSIQVYPDFAHQELFNLSTPFDYSGIEWGWLHIGLSLDTYRADIKDMHMRVTCSALIALLIALAGSFLYARHITSPIIKLSETVRQISRGNLSVSAKIHGSREIAELANSVNLMTSSLSERSKVLEVLRSTAQQLLASSQWEEKVPAIIEHTGATLHAAAMGIFENVAEQPNRMDYGHRFSWHQQPESSPGSFQFPDSLDWGFNVFHDQLEKGTCLTIQTAEMTDLYGQKLLQSKGIHSIMIAPILLRNQLWGLLIAASDVQSSKWTHIEFDTFSAVADMLSTVLERNTAQAELLASKERAEAASLAKTRFLANMSHEIRTPINGIMGMLQLLQRSNLNEQNAGYIDTAMHSSRTLLNVIGNILDLSKIEAGKIDIEARNFSLNDLCAEALEPFGNLADEKGIELAYFIDASATGSWNGAGTRIQQILINLINNAFKFTSHGEIVLSCSATQLNADMPELVFEVRDTGTGISPADQKRVFDSFVQLDDSLTRSQPGTGLGLTICRDLSRMLGGSISVQSVHGAGSTFTARIPVTRNLTDTQTEAHEADNIANAVRILIADDSSTVRKILNNYASSWGFIVDAVASEADCLNHLRRASAEGVHYDLVLMDRSVPSSDISDLVQRIRQLTFTKKIRFILLDCFSNPLSAEELARCGFAGSVRKPARKSRLYNAISNALAEKVPGKFITRLIPTPAFQVLEAPLQGRVLVAEDNAINQEVVVELLRILGLQPECVSNGLDALNRIKNKHFDYLLLDCQMPVMDGYAAAREIRIWEDSQNVQNRLPIIALTAHAMEGDKEHCLAAGMDDYLSKPLEFERLQVVLQRWQSNPSPPSKAPSAMNQATLTQNGLSVIDTELFLKRLQGNVALAQRLIKKFFSQTTTDLGELEKAVSDQDAETLRLVSHRIKGAALTVSAQGIGEIAKALEKSDAMDWRERASMVADLKVEISKLEGASEMFLAVS